MISVQSHEAVIRHECGHASALIALGVIPESIDVTGWGKYRGYVTYPRHFAGRSDRGAALIAAKSILAAWLSECGRPAAWPLGNPTIDEQDLQGISHALGWRRENYEAIVEETKHLVTTPAFTYPYMALYTALLQVPYLTESDIKKVVGIQHKATRADTSDPMAAVKRIEARWQDEEARSIIEQLEAGTL